MRFWLWYDTSGHVMQTVVRQAGRAVYDPATHHWVTAWRLVRFIVVKHVM